MDDRNTYICTGNVVSQDMIIVDMHWLPFNYLQLSNIHIIWLLISLTTQYIVYIIKIHNAKNLIRPGHLIIYESSSVYNSSVFLLAIFWLLHYLYFYFHWKFMKNIHYKFQYIRCCWIYLNIYIYIISTFYNFTNI